MPHLGVDIAKIIDLDDTTSRNAIRQCPVPIVFQQIIKLLEQIDRLGSQGYIHGDIRDTNLMIQPSDGTMTLIDFDWMMPYDEFYSDYSGFGYYSNPPEFLMKVNLSSILAEEGLTPDLLRSDMPHLFSYVTRFEEQFPFVNAVTPTLKEAILSANLKNIEFLRTHTLKSCLPTVDGFGLACSLLTLFYYLYPGSCHSETTPESLQSSLSTRITKHGEPYNDRELSACSNAILSLVRTVLLPMASFEIDARPTTSVALTKTKQIYSILSEAFFPEGNSIEDPLNEETVRRRNMVQLALLAAKAGNTSVLEQLVHGTNRKTKRNNNRRNNNRSTNNRPNNRKQNRVQLALLAAQAGNTSFMEQLIKNMEVHP
jgi:serine/threonine protein kinase